MYISNDKQNHVKLKDVMNSFDQNFLKIIS